MVLFVLLIPGWNDQGNMKPSHTHLYGLHISTESPFRLHRLAVSVEASLGLIEARAFGERRQGRSHHGLAIVRSAEGFVMCRIILCCVPKSNHCHWHSHHQASVAPEQYEERAHLRITSVSTSVAKVFLLNFLSQYKYSATGITPFLDELLNLLKAIVSALVLKI
jgi:hypothetical protein